MRFKKAGFISVLGACGLYYVCEFLAEEKKKNPQQQVMLKNSLLPTQVRQPVFAQQTVQATIQPENNLKKDIERQAWNLEETGLTPEELTPFFQDGEPSAITIRRDGKEDVFWNPNFFGSGNGFGKILHLSDSQAIQQVVNERKNIAEKNTRNPIPQEIQLDTDAYELVSFSPGFRDDHKNKIAAPENLAKSITGPDHRFDSNDLLELRSRLVSFGHGGEMVLRVKHNGWILNREGPDFVIFENPMRIGGKSGLLYQELAHVGVAEENSPEKYQWFECHPLTKNISGCAGVVPTDEGGDQFDLSTLGVDKIRFIKIRDTGKNKNFGFSANTEGFDLDALRLLNAFVTKDG